jgi:hypothetical protein
MQVDTCLMSSPRSDRGAGGTGLGQQGMPGNNLDGGLALGSR